MKLRFADWVMEYHPNEYYKEEWVQEYDKYLHKDTIMRRSAKGSMRK